MSNTTHTPGKWSFITDSCSGDNGIRAEGTGIFAEAFADIRHAGEGAREEAIANARLIAAAPEMLEALKRAERFIANGIEFGFIRMPEASTPDPAHDTPDIIRAVIAKAEGWQS